MFLLLLCNAIMLLHTVIILFLVAPSTLVSFTGKNRRADLIIKPKEDFYLALQQSRQTRQAVEQVTFEFRTATIEAVVLSSRTEDGSGNLGVFWVS